MERNGVFDTVSLNSKNRHEKRPLVDDVYSQGQKGGDDYIFASLEPPISPMKMKFLLYIAAFCIFIKQS